MSQLGYLFRPDEMYQLVTEKWGFHAQTTMVSEEFGEYLVALSKLIRHGVNPERIDALVDETADVLVMVEQMAQAFGLSGKRIEARYNEKRGRLNSRLASGHKEGIAL
ncbi:MAG: hypothetical protein WC551_10130 [Patescibacteria group bacterium]